MVIITAAGEFLTIWDLKSSVFKISLEWPCREFYGDSDSTKIFVKTV